MTGSISLLQEAQNLLFDLAVNSSGVLEAHKAEMRAAREQRSTRRRQRANVRKRTLEGTPCLKTMRARRRHALTLWYKWKGQLSISFALQD